MGKRIIPQHEPLRVPKGWTEQARAFVIQLERIIDRIYAYISGGFSKHDEELEKTNEKINGKAGQKVIIEYVDGSLSKTYTGIQSGLYLLTIAPGSVSTTECYMGVVVVQGPGPVTIKPIKTSSSITVTSDANNSITCSSSFRYCNVNLLNLRE